MFDYSSLAALLLRIKACDEATPPDYATRYRLVFMALAQALCDGYPAGVRIDPDEPAWPVVCIELPTGQVSWHMPAHGQAWDGHSTETKYERVDAFAALPTMDAA